MNRPSAQDFLHKLLESIDDLPPDLARRFDELLKKEDAGRAEAIRLLFEELAGD
jgi:metal-responsive CopG/Arc/MetJ family transcriptional regulator